MVLGGFLIFLIVCMVVVMASRRGLGRDIDTLVTCASVVSGLAFLFWFLFTLSAVRNAITAHLGEDQRSF